MHKLLIEDDEGKTVAVPLIREEITIGRTEGNTIRLTEQNVSRKHARLTLRNGVLRIEDLGSYNGTSLNGSALSGVSSLKDGDVILIGDYRLGIQEDRSSQAVPATSSSSEGASTAPPVEAMLDGQPTIPISTMLAQAKKDAPTAFSEPSARLVITSRFMSGTEFILDRPSHVVGRTGENDIIINHKSISRHHAKIVREGSRYVILDLESANGVRVGGTERDRIELQSGDVIELGEVRLRFLSGDSALYDEPRAWYKNKSLLGLAVGGGIAAVGFLLYFAFSGVPSQGAKVAHVDDKPPVAATAQATPPTVQPTPPTPPPAEEPKPAGPLVPVAELLAQAKKDAQAEKWEEALVLLGKVIEQEPGSTDAANLRKAIKAEKQYSDKLVALKAAMANKEFEAVLQGTTEFPDESMYKPRAVGLHKSAQVQFVATHLEAAKTKLAANDCEEARREAELVLGLEAKNRKAAAVVKRCEVLAKQAAASAATVEAPKPELVAVAPKPAPAPAAPKPARRLAAAPVAVRAPTAKAKPATVEPSKPEPALAAADADKLIKEAQQAWFRGQYAVAIDSARKALRVKPNLTNAYQIIAVCSCALHDADSAAKALERLDERNKQFVKSACQKNGISF
jgi:pSer/pThr/pTyr-binding forkhead associated (FHA) protein/tetratricopeptide (TPR) repeat protein